MRDEGSSDVMEDVGNLRRRPAAAHRNPLTPTKQTPPATGTSGGVEVKESCVNSLQPGNREEHEEVRWKTGRH